MAASGFLESPLLFFLNDKVDVMNHDDLVRICSSFYSEEEIKESKQTLFRLLNSEGDLVDIRTDARKKNVSDLIRLLYTSQELITVKFCVTNTRRLPPVSLDHIDVAALLKSVLEAKTELIKCQNAQARTEEKLRDEIEHRNTELATIKASLGSQRQGSYAAVAGTSSEAPPNNRRMNLQSQRAAPIRSNTNVESTDNSDASSSREVDRTRAS